MPAAEPVSAKKSLRLTGWPSASSISTGMSHRQELARANDGLQCRR